MGLLHSGHTFFPEGFHQYLGNFCLGDCLFLSILDLGGFSQQQLSVTNEDICLKRELSPMMVFKIQGEKWALTRGAIEEGQEGFSSSVAEADGFLFPEQQLALLGVTMAWCFSGASLMGLAVPWHLRKGKAEWQKAISWASDLQKQMCFVPCLYIGAHQIICH